MFWATLYCYLALYSSYCQTNKHVNSPHFYSKFFLLELLELPMLHKDTL